VGSGVVRIDPLHFLAGCHKTRLNQALSVLVLGFFCVCSFVLFIRTTLYVSLVCVSVFCLLIVLVNDKTHLSVEFSPRVGSGVVRIDPLYFLAGCHKTRLNQALSVLVLVFLCVFFCAVY